MQKTRGIIQSIRQNIGDQSGKYARIGTAQSVATRRYLFSSMWPGYIQSCRARKRYQLRADQVLMRFCGPKRVSLMKSGPLIDQSQGLKKQDERQNVKTRPPPFIFMSDRFGQCTTLQVHLASLSRKTRSTTQVISKKPSDNYRISCSRADTSS